jgi:hypothetical protein
MTLGNVKVVFWLFTARYGLIPYIKQIVFRIQKLI